MKPAIYERQDHAEVVRMREPPAAETSSLPDDTASTPEFGCRTTAPPAADSSAPRRLIFYQCTHSSA